MASGPGKGSARALADDVAAAVEELRAKGVVIIKEPWEADVCERALIQGPDGNVLMLHRRKDGTVG